jgi:SNF family Na+-dependent transporter
MAMGFMLAVIGLAGVVGSLVMPPLASGEGGVPMAIWFCIITQVVSFVCMLVAVFIDRHAKKVDPAEKEEKKPFQMK